MKKVFKNVSFVLLLLKMCIIFGQEIDGQEIIIIDPGHGGIDSGAIGLNGIQEKDIVLDISLEILNLIGQLEKPLEIYLTRYSDTLISLSDRTKLAKVLNADVFISLHCNHSDNPNARGIEVYVSNNESHYLDDSTWLAFQLQAALKREMGFESRGVKFGNFQVLRGTTTYCPSILVEFGFLSNRDESKYYQKSKNLVITSRVLLECLMKNFTKYGNSRNRDN